MLPLTYSPQVDAVREEFSHPEKIILMHLVKGTKGKQQTS